MSNARLPVDSYVTVPPTGTEMRPANWHALVDGLEFEGFGVDDFANGDARVIATTTTASDLPPLEPGQVWQDPSNTVLLWTETTVSFGLPIGFHSFEILAWPLTTISAGMPVYMEGLKTPASGVSNWIVPNVSPIVVAESTPFRPGMGIALDSGTFEGPVIRVGLCGLMYGWTADTNVTHGDGAYLDIAGGDEENLLAQPGNDFADAPAGRAGIGLWMEARAAGGPGPLRMWKFVTPWDEQRT